MPKSVRILISLFALIFIGAAAVLGYTAIEGSKPLAASAIAAREDGVLPPLPTIGVPGAVAPEEELLDVTPETAKEINDSRPFTSEPIEPAAPFAGMASGDDGERAVVCLATAGWYEAGAGSSDQSAVMQVVLNRVRHPAFPNSVCGVVFQGSERRTGCQFSFTCDGSMLRRQPSAAAWQSAMGLARAMLEGHVDERVGLATHFHTDWVVPYWSSSLVKLTNVQTHLFFRWEGFWGTLSAFRETPAAREPMIAALASRSTVHAASSDVDDEAALADVSLDVSPLQPTDDADLAPGTSEYTAVPMQPAVNTVALRRLRLPAGAGAGRWALDAVAMCADQPICRVVGWSDPAAAPASLDPSSFAAFPPDLVFVKVSRDRREQAFWNCDLWPQASTSRCLGSASATVRLLYAE